MPHKLKVFSIMRGRHGGRSIRQLDRLCSESGSRKRRRLVFGFFLLSSQFQDPAYAVAHTQREFSFLETPS